MDLNLAKCIKVSTNFGYTIYHNICSATSVRVYWGFFDWLVMGLFGLFAFVIIIAVLYVFSIFIYYEMIYPIRRKRK